MNGFNCPLCGQQGELFFQHYQHCQQCDLIAADPDHHLSHADEKAQYDLHQNSPNDHAYRKFLNQLLEPVSQLMPPPARALDFGCGPGPTVSVMLAECGYDCSNYDPIYSPDQSVLKKSYDLITMTEVIEHCSDPLKEIRLLRELLKPGGYLGLMTDQHPGPKDFETWHYKNDPTHISFFSDQTINWLAQACNFEIELIQPRVIILCRG